METAAAAGLDIIKALDGVKLAEHAYESLHSGSFRLLCSTALLRHPGGKEYRGHIGLREPVSAPGEWDELAALGTYGRTDGMQRTWIAAGEDLAEVLAALDARVQAKLKKGYQPVPGTGWTAITERDVVAAARAALAGEMLPAQLSQSGLAG